MRKAIAAWVLALTVVSCGGGAPVNYDYKREIDIRQHEYVIGVSDGLRITVWKNGDLSTSAIVRPDGTITMPLLGDLRAAGRTPGQLREEVRQRLAQYVKDESAVVTVAVTDVNSYRFVVSGNVESPGVFTSKHYVTASEAIAMAGGPNRFASANETVIIRTGADRKQRKIPIRYDDIRSGSRPDMDLVIHPGDTVFVP